MTKWEVVGGGVGGGITVREGEKLSTPACKTKLSMGAIIIEIEIVGDRLHYQRLKGAGPDEGWVSIKALGKELVRPVAERQDDEVLDIDDMDEPGNDAGEAMGPIGPSSGAPLLDASTSSKLEADAKKRERAGDLSQYCNKYKPLGFPLASPMFRVLCFHCEGCAESTFTQEGTAFLKWVEASGVVEVCAVDYPGRHKLLRSTKQTSADTLAQLLVEVLYSKVADGVPYAIWSHGVGTWVAFEFLMLCRKAGLPMPKVALFNAFPAPHLPSTKRPWRRSKTLNDDKLRVELSNWDRTHFTGPGRLVLENSTWENTWSPLIRADFQLFDEYRFKHNGAQNFDFPIHAWHFEDEHYIKPEMVELWSEWTSADFNFSTLRGMGHLSCIFRMDFRNEYFGKVTQLLKRYADPS